MRRVVTIGLAGALALGLGACNKGGGTVSGFGGGGGQSQSSSQSAPPTSSSAPTSDSMSSTTSDASTDATSDATGSSSAATAGPTGGAAAGKVSPAEQASPDAVVMAFMTAIGDGNGRKICNLISYQGMTFDSLGESMMGECETMMSSQIGSLGPQLKPYLSSLKITGATVTGDKATFTNVKVEPPYAAASVKDMLKSFSAIKVKGKWYLNIEDTTSK